MKIVIIEDNPDILDIIDYILKDVGYEVFSCPDGTIVKNLDKINPDVILLDEILPSVRGSEICKQLKMQSEFKDVPVILVSTIPHLAKIAQQCGADSYLEKPFNIQDLTNIIQQFNRQT